MSRTLSRRSFLAASTAAGIASAAPPALNARERVERALSGKSVDRPPFTFWYHFLDEKEPAEKHAANTLKFHRKFRTDLVKVMSDYPYPKPAAEWFALREDKNPFPAQIRSLELIRDGLAGKALFVETIFNPWNVAGKLSSPEQVERLKRENPQRLLDALEIIAKSEANHVRRAIAAGASGIFLAIANHDPDYAKFSEPFDRMVLDAVRSAPLNILHLHGDKVPLERFYSWPAAAINYSEHTTGVRLNAVRAKFPGVLMGGLDERNVTVSMRTGTKRNWIEAMRAAEPKFILSPGCSVPNDARDEDLLTVTRMFGA